MSRPSDDELEAMAARLDAARTEWYIPDGQDIAAMLRACKGRAGPDWEGFGRDLLESWPVGDIDGSELFDAALRHGLIREIPGGYDPEKHIDTEGICPERGDPFYEYAFGEARNLAPDHSDWNAAIEAAAKVARNCIYHDSVGTGFDEDKFDAAIQQLKKGPPHD